MLSSLIISISLYLCKVILISGLLYGYYRIFLRNRAFHGYNRLYLLSVPVLSLVLPFVHLSIFRGEGLWASPVTSPVFSGLYAITEGHWQEQETAAMQAHLQPSIFTWQNLAMALYFLVSILLLRSFIRQLRYICALRSKYNGEKIRDIRFFYTCEPGTPFSFLHSIFWDEKIDRNSIRGKEMFRHELYHVRQKHTIDILWMRSLLILFWINPLFRLLYRELRAVHEFQADAYAIAGRDATAYAELLVWQTVSAPSSALLQPFFHSPIKRRVNMLIQSKNQGQSHFSRIMVLPLFILVCSAFAVGSHPPVNNSLRPAGGELTVVIDPGHGGIDAGAENAEGLREKDIVLQIAERVRQQASASYHIHVILTRTNDALPGNAASKLEGLDQRIAITKENKADLFISLHVNNAGNAVPPGGIEAYISGKPTDQGSARLATSLLKQLRHTYTVSSDIKKRDDAIRVLDQSPCPAVLLELGYIDLPKDCQFITAADNQEKIAHDILEGIVHYQ